jgi:hypothetical protein
LRLRISAAKKKYTNSCVDYDFFDSLMAFDLTDYLNRLVHVKTTPVMMMIMAVIDRKEGISSKIK